MQEIPFSEIKDIELDILKYIDTICFKNGITYSLAYGTLLGAIRHKGFIPWDDDIDICMNRENFNRFMKAIQSERNEKYELLWIETNKEYTLPLPKVVDKTTVLTQNTQREKKPIGVYVDVFIFDKIPTDPKVREKHIRKLELYQRFWGYSQNKYVWKDHSIKSHIRFLVYSIFHLFNPRFFSKMLNRVAQKNYNYKDNDYYIGSMLYSAVKRDKAWYNPDFFEHFERIPFEDGLFLASSFYDEMLTVCYGNYMEYPPVEKRVSHHDFSVYYRDDIKK